MNRFIDFSGKLAPKLFKFSIFLVYFWFGLLKVTGDSPASPMVLKLLDRTMPFMDAATFLILFGLFEVVIGLLFLVPRLEKLATVLLAIHLITTILPLFLLPQFTWTGFLTPTMEGQYIIKNILIIALAFGIIARFRTSR
jgi:uncharacterized membrane protein YkgB